MFQNSITHKRLQVAFENINVTSQGQITFILTKKESNKKEGEGGAVGGRRSQGEHGRAPFTPCPEFPYRHKAQSGFAAL